MNRAVVVFLIAGAAASLAAFSPIVVLGQPARSAAEIDDDYSQLALFEDDPTEIASLPASRKLFADFCLRARDEVKVFLKESANTGAKRVFNILFNSDDDFDDFNIDNEDVDDEDVEASAKIIKAGINQEAAAAAAAEPNLEAKVEAVKRSSVWATLSQAVQTVINSAIEFVSSEAAKRLARLRARFSPAEIKTFIKDACDSVTFTLRKQLSGSLLQEQRQLINMDAAGQFKQAIAEATIDDVGCVTTGRIAMVGKACGFLNVAGPAIYPLFGL